jgi:integrase
MATAKREGLIRDNPAVGAAWPHRPRIAEDEELPRPFPCIDGVETMEMVVALVHTDHRPMFKLLAATGLRRSELLALEVRHLHLTGDQPHVKVRQRTRLQKGQGGSSWGRSSRVTRAESCLSRWISRTSCERF